MTTSSTRTNEREDVASHRTQDTDWVIVKEEISEGYELIDAAEAQCWCGGSDAERCRLRGHTWPLCNIDQGELWPESPDGILYQPHEEETETESSDSPDERTASRESNADDSKEIARKPTPQKETHEPWHYERGPFTTLAVLTEMLDKGRYTGA
ncbi:hypothetical protein INS49_004263 [Diaporthe citri]|uniref:uncharacterized protein n=1 Tax=Diaporthe citri TaxID=83186 RepID=UPI001C7E7382|nr:uncharacterized protein INS49_004263 [Diaporthe citri]KAG6355182.1 hypothetical protein INS49_004263 [Diaporthe citri]